MEERSDEKVDKIREIIIGSKYQEMEAKVNELSAGFEALRHETRADRLSFERRIDYMQNDFAARISKQSQSIFGEKAALEQKVDRLAQEVSRLADIVEADRRSRHVLAETLSALAQNLRAEANGDER